jgi:hypothetical protein
LLDGEAERSVMRDGTSEKGGAAGSTFVAEDFDVGEACGVVVVRGFLCI